MEFLSPISIPKPLAPINDQNLKKGRPLFELKLVLEIRFSDALFATEVIKTWSDCSYTSIFLPSVIGRLYRHTFK